MRSTYVIGPDDYTWRFPGWVERITVRGDVLAPEPADAPAQVIDGRDMASWIVRGVTLAADPAKADNAGRELLRAWAATR